MQLGLLMSEKCGVVIANSICIQYADLQILDSLPKSLLRKLADSLHFSDEPEGTCRREGDKVEYSAKISGHRFVVCTMQCHLATPRGAGMSLQHGTFPTRVRARTSGSVSIVVMSPNSMAMSRQTSLSGARSGTAVASAVDPPKQHPQVTLEWDPVFKGI